ncbi:MAG: hypothetical protein HYR90_01395 [Candidatus Andersenbacteria bacterium]|nr:hypothetical protein [Candidatus Andersenbacteria bacterium]MBI3250812.1 hypothetical protein [Candidatus Andersenbacteria bacterium]
MDKVLGSRWRAWLGLTLSPAKLSLKELSRQGAEEHARALNSLADKETLRERSRRQAELHVRALNSLAEEDANPDKTDTPPSRRLITLVSTKDKTSKKVVREVWRNFQKYKRVEAEVLSRLKKSSQQD